MLIQFLFMFLDLSHLEPGVRFNPASADCVKKLIRLLTVFVDKFQKLFIRNEIGIFRCQNSSSDFLCRFAIGIRKDRTDSQIRNSQTVLISIGFRGVHSDKLVVVSADFTQLTDWLKRNKRASDKVVLIEVTNLFGIFLVSLLTLDSLCVLGVSKTN